MKIFSRKFLKPVSSLTVILLMGVVSIYAQCTVYDVGGGGAITATNTSFPITLSGSQAGVNYQLYRYGVAVGSPIAGTGNTLTWTSQSAEGPFTVVATGSGCTQQMNGSASISYPAAFNSYYVQWTNLVGVNYSGNTLTRTISGAWTSGASSSNILPANTDGWVEFQANTSANQAMIGLSSIDASVSYTSINFTFNQVNGQVFENGVSKLTSPPAVSPWEIFRIERVGGKIYYKRNGTLVFTSTQTSTSSLIVDCSINNATVVDVTASFGVASQPTVSIAKDAVWQNQSGTVSNFTNTLNKTTAAGWGNSGASTLNTLNPNTDGWLEFTLNNTSEQKAIGLTRFDNDANYTSIDYAILLDGASASVVLAGLSQMTFIVAAGDILRVERLGTNIYFKQNGVTKYSVPNCYTTLLIGDASLNTAGATLSNVQVSFWIPYAQGTVPDYYEFSALKTFYDSLNGAAWTTKTNWPTSGGWPTSATATQMGTWYGITVLANDISQISFNNNKVIGKIPVAIARLNSLSVLSLINSKITGLPAELTSLKNLSNLTMNACQLTGNLNPAWSSLFSLTTLNLGSNSFTGTIPDSWGSLTNLKSLTLNNNSLTGAIPITALAGFTSLKTLNLSANSFTGSIPTVISTLAKLATLDLSSNNLSGVIPTWIGGLTSLVTLNLNNNTFSGNIPAQIGSLSSLSVLDLSYNQFTNANIPSTLYSLTTLTELDFTGCPLGGTIPTQLGNLVNLSVLQLAFCSLTGTIPHEFGNLVNLTRLYLNSNQLTGNVPGEFSNFKKLTILQLSINQLNGPLPEFFGSYASISTLYLQYNQFTGGIPTSYANLSSIVSFQVNNNLLSGPVHDGLFANWTKATTISLSYNSFSGAFPSSIGSVVKLGSLYGNNNFFTSLPGSLNQLPIVTLVNFQYNLLVSVPDFSTQSNKVNLALYLQNNMLDFVQIKALKSQGLKSVTVKPQNNIHDITLINVPQGGALTIPARPMNTTTTITWEKQTGPTTWVSVNSSDQDASLATYYIAVPTISNAGIYHYKMTDATVQAGMTITSDPITVNITDSENQNGSYLGTALYNGNITAAAWHTEAAYATGNADYNGMYLYKYDDKYQIQEAQYANPNFGNMTFALAGNTFREFGYTYDPNGNIQTLKRYDGNVNANKIHDLAYAYTAGNNMLQAVTNSGAAFRSYSYNAIGQMTTQDNATGTDQIVDYDVTGKVTDVYSDAAKTIKTTHYTYDDRGFRLSKETYKNDTLKFTTWYIRDASGNVLSIYNQQAGDTNLTQEEVPIYGSGKLGMYRPKSVGRGEFVYELTDHLGNVRATIKNDQSIYLATMEDTGAGDITNPRVTEGAYFTNLFETEKRDTRMNHTVSTDCNNCTPANSSYLSWTTNDTNKKMIGVGITLKVEKDDILNLEAWAKYQNQASGTYTRDATAAMMAGLLSSAFVGTNGLELTTTAAQNFTNAIPLAIGGTSNDPGTRPYAYLNYLVFDQNFAPMDGGAMRVQSGSGFDAGMEAATGHIQQVSFAPITIHQTGFIYVWVSNETAGVPVWWDDLKVTHTGNRVTQATDYYPFGLVMRSQTLSTEPTYRHGYQGKFAEKDDETGWNHFQAREFDPLIGRWLIPDPAREFESSYQAFGNDPINRVDPTGAYTNPTPAQAKAILNSYSTALEYWANSKAYHTFLKYKNGEDGMPTEVTMINPIVVTGVKFKGGWFDRMMDGNKYRQTIKFNFAGKRYKVLYAFNNSDVPDANTISSIQFYGKTVAENYGDVQWMVKFLGPNDRLIGYMAFFDEKSFKSFEEAFSGIVKNKTANLVATLHNETLDKYWGKYMDPIKIDKEMGTAPLKGPITFENVEVELKE